jgi:hypothetical protein
LPRIAASASGDFDATLVAPMSVAEMKRTAATFFRRLSFTALRICVIGSVISLVA